MQHCSVSFCSFLTNFGGKITTKFKQYNKKWNYFAFFSAKQLKIIEIVE